MRRISLALALVGAVAAGCSGGAKAPAGTGIAKGVTGQYYYVNLFSPPIGGIVTSSDGRINCGVSAVAVVDLGTPPAHDYQYAYTYYGTAPDLTNKCGQFQYQWAQSVTLTAAGQGGNAFTGWAADCSGTLTCALSAGSDRSVVAIFGTPGSGHGPFMDPAVHGPAYNAYWAAVTAVPPTTPALDCTRCHATDLQGMGIAPSCGGCHAVPAVLADLAQGHFVASGHASGACARCHTASGFRDFIGVDGTPNFTTVGYTSTGGGVCISPNTPAGCSIDGVACTAPNTPAGCTITSGMDCAMCHNGATVLGALGGGTKGTLNQKKFASGVTLTLDGKTAICAQCHDGGRPGYEIAQLNVNIGATAVDNLLTNTQKTSRSHYLPATSTMFGAEANTFAQFPGMIYTARNEHGGIAACSDCHNPHNGDLPADRNFATTCGKCHFNEAGASVSSFLELEETRQYGFEGDIDGDGLVEPLVDEITGLKAVLASAIKAYALYSTPATPICLLPDRAYAEVNALVACNVAPNNVEYNKFTPRLLRANFNWQIANNDPGAWAHNPRYVIEVLVDTIADVNAGLPVANRITTPVKRAFNGHFGGADAATPYAAMVYHAAPPQGFTSGACYQCHGGNGGLTAYLATAPAALGAPAMVNKVTSFQCSTCHVNNGTSMTTIRNDVGTVYYPSQKGNPAAANALVVSFASTALPNSFALCGTCHAGRENAASVELSFAGKTGNWDVSFLNPHYLGASAVVLGNEAKMLYQYPSYAIGNVMTEYAGTPVFWKPGTNGNAPGPHGSPHGAECTGCHQPKGSKHSFEVDMAWCNSCHVQAPYGDYRLAPVKANVTAMATTLYGTITAYAQAAGHAVCYNGAAYPYWFQDNGTGGGVASNGTCETGESVAANGAKLDFKAAKAAFNYKWSQAEPGAYAHNYEYIAQVLFDAIRDLDPAAVMPIDAHSGNGFMPANTPIARP